MNDERIKCFIKRIEEIIGPCTYDEKDEEYGTLELYADEHCDMGIEIDTETLTISLFASFSYTEFSKTDIGNIIYEVEELESETSTRLLESSFILYLKSHSPNYIVSIWDDGHFMCPGYVARVGFFNEIFTDALVKEFLNLYQKFWSTIAHLSDFELRKYIFKSICHSYSIKLIENEKIFFENAALKIGDNQNTPNSNVECYYMGKEKFLFSVAGKCYASDACPHTNIYGST